MCSDLQVPSKGALAVLLGVTLGITLPVAASGAEQLSVFPPEGSRYGTYSDLSAEWWQWSFSIPVCQAGTGPWPACEDGEVLHPLFDETGEKCEVGQRGDVWFLGAEVIAEPREGGGLLAEVTRSCEVPVGKALFIPILNAQCSFIDTPDAAGESDLRACAEGLIDSVVEAEMTIDGEPVSGLLSRFRGPSSPLVPYVLPEDNVQQALGFEAPGGSEDELVADGIHVLLYPAREPGTHEIALTSRADVPVGDGEIFVFEVDVLYTVHFVEE